MDRLRLLLSVLMFAMAIESPALAHPWYPAQCCSLHDCMTADSIVPDTANGGRIVVAGRQRVQVPPDFPVRASPDGLIHICFRIITEPEQGIFTMPLCLFVPAQS
jgi:hypothetical protein